MADMFDFLENISNQEQDEDKKVKINEGKKNEKTYGLFDYVNQINLKTNELDFNEKLCSGYMLTLHYSHENKLLNIVNKINKYVYSLNNKLVYDYFYDLIPKGKRFTKWVKKNKNKEEIYKKLMEKYNISYREAKESLKNLEI